MRCPLMVSLVKSCQVLRDPVWGYCFEGIGVGWTKDDVYCSALSSVEIVRHRVANVVSTLSRAQEEDLEWTGAVICVRGGHRILDQPSIRRRFPLSTSLTFDHTSNLNVTIWSQSSSQNHSEVCSCSVLPRATATAPVQTNWQAIHSL